MVTVYLPDDPRVDDSIRSFVERHANEIVEKHSRLMNNYAYWTDSWTDIEDAPKGRQAQIRKALDDIDALESIYQRLRVMCKDAAPRELTRAYNVYMPWCDDCPNGGFPAIEGDAWICHECGEWLDDVYWPEPEPD